MKVIFYLFTTLIALCTTTTVKSQTVAAPDKTRQECMNFNVKIQSATDTLYTLASLWGTTFIDLYNGTQQYEDLTPIRSDLQEIIEQTLKDFKSVNDVSGSQKLQEAMLALFDFEKTLMQNGFQPFEKLTPQSTEDEINKCRDRLKEESAKEKGFLVALNDARKEYASRNGIPLVPPPPPPPPPKIVPKSGVKKPGTTLGANAQNPTAAQKPPAKPQPLISEPIQKKVDKTTDDDKDEKEEKEEKDDKEEK